MPLFNAKNYLYYSLRSIQNQRMKDIEIILINDASTDDTLNITEKLREEDPRIRIINNEKNRRILYSKSIGALYANGKYILELDQDDMFLSDKTFNIIYNEAEKDNLDLLQFRDFELKQFKFDKNVKCNGMVFAQQTKIEIQPNIKNSMFKKYNYFLWGLLMKSDLYKKAVINYWPIIINYKIIHYEDFSITFFIAILAKRFKYINNFYLAHLSHNNSASSNQNFKKEYHTSVLLFYNNMFEYHVKYNLDDIRIFNNLVSQNKGQTLQIQKTAPKFFEFVFKKIYDYFPNNDKKKFMNQLKLSRTHIQMANTSQYFMNDNEYKSILSFQNSINKKAKIIYKSTLIPKLSIIIYFTDKNFLENTIYSIENQKYFSDFEIILIYDNNNEIILDYINKLIINYENIKLFYTIEKNGLFYSYYTGILHSKGEYILTIKSGYTLSKENALYELYKELGNDTDILEFNLLNNYNDRISDTSLKLYRCSHFKSEINLDSFKFNENYREIDQEKELMFNKIIKADIYKNITEEHKNIFIQFSNNYYNEIIMYLIEQKNITIKHSNIFGLIEYSKITNYINTSKIYDINNKIIEDSILYINFLYDNSEDSVNGKRLALNEFYNIMNVIYNKFNELSEDGINLLYKFLKSKYISNYEKTNLIVYYNGLIDRNKYNTIMKEYYVL